MSSFYGGNGGVTSKVVNSLISDSSKKAKRHIVASESEPFGQQVGDLWLVLEKDENENKTRVDLTYNTAEGIFEGQIETGIMTAAQLEAGYDFYGEIDGNEVSFMVAEITDQPDCTLIKLFSPMVEGIVECGYYYKTGRITKRLRAILDNGLVVNNKMKVLTGSLSASNYNMNIRYSFTSSDSKVENINFVNNLSNNFIATEMNTISSTESDIPIYIEWDNTNKIINIYAESNELKCQNNSMISLFDRFKSLLNLSILEKIDYSNVSSLNMTFAYLDIITQTPVIENNDNLKSIAGLFINCQNLVDISSMQLLNVDNIENINSLFSSCKKLIDISSISNWNTSNVIYMGSLFSHCPSLLDISALQNWNTSNVIDMANMFAGTYSQFMKITDFSALSNWNVSKVTSISNMFAYNDLLSDISFLQNWNVSKVTDLTSVFVGCKSLSDISVLESWNVSNVIRTPRLFSQTAITNLNSLQHWNVSKISNMQSMFSGCQSLSDISALQNWDVSNVQGVDTMFAGCTSLSDISALQNWDVSKAITTFGMFQQCSSLSDISVLENWNVSNVTDFGTMFRGCNLITVSLPNWDIRKATATQSRYPYYGLGSMFANNPNLEQVYLTNWDFSNVKQMTNMFENTPKLQHVYVSQASYDSFLRAVDNGCNITNMWKDSNISQFTIIDS